MQRFSRIPEINERRLRQRLEDTVERQIKDGLITDAKVLHVDCEHPDCNQSLTALKPSESLQDLQEAARRIAEAQARD